MDPSATDLPFDNRPWVILVNKPVGHTSYDVIRKLKPKIFKELGKGKGRRKLKIGHFGTLDPFADGLLLVGTGKALKLVHFFQNEMSKIYRGRGSFEFSTDTGDIDGEIVDKGASYAKDVPTLDLLRTKASEFVGLYQQAPPYFSAVKHDGRPLYEWARQGTFIDKPPVQREVFSFSILEKLADNSFTFEATVSSGTYIRGLWFDLAKAVSLPGHLQTLTRVGWGNINLGDWQESVIEGEKINDFSRNHLIRVDKLWDLPSMSLPQNEADLFSRGVYVAPPFSNRPDPYQWVYGPGRELLGLGVPVKVHGKDLLKVEVNLT